MIKDYNEYAQIADIKLWPCAYLHNYLREENDPLDDAIYADYLNDAPAFTKGDVRKLRAYIKEVVKRETTMKSSTKSTTAESSPPKASRMPSLECSKATLSSI